MPTISTDLLEKTIQALENAQATLGVSIESERRLTAHDVGDVLEDIDACYADLTAIAAEADDGSE